MSVPSKAIAQSASSARPIYSYVADPKSSFPKLICSICFEPFFKPLKTPCRHTFCEECVQRVASTGQPCPICRATITASSLVPGDDTLQELLADLEVYCAHRQQGCTWKGPRFSFQEHVERTCEKIAEKQRQRRELEKLYITLNPPASDVVKLSVGGRIFETTRSTLCTKDPNSVLAALFSEPDKLQTNKEGSVFLDLDPDAFELILAWLRLGVIPRELSRERADRLAVVVKALRLELLAAALASLQAQPGQRFISVEGLYRPQQSIGYRHQHDNGLHVDLDSHLSNGYSLVSTSVVHDPSNPQWSRIFFHLAK